MRAALQQVPMPIIDMGDDEVMVFMSLSAQALLHGVNPLLGNELAKRMLELSQALHDKKEGERRFATINDVS